MGKDEGEADRLGRGFDRGAEHGGSRGAVSSDKLREAITKKTHIAARLKHVEARLNGVLVNIERQSLKKLLNALCIVKKHKVMMLDDESYSVQNAKNLIQELEDVLVEETSDDGTRYGLSGRHVGQPEQERYKG